MEQLSLFETEVLKATDKYGTTGATYGAFAQGIGLSGPQMDELVDAGRGGMVSKWRRKIRFIQQTLKHKGLIKRGLKLGQWNVTAAGNKHLTKAPFNSLRAYFITKRGIAFWGDGNNMVDIFDGEVDLIITSPPYLLTKDRQYGNIGTTVQGYVDNLLKMAEGWMKMLSPTGSIVLNINDSYVPNSGHQSLHKERLLIALEDRLGLHLVQNLPWWSPCKMPTGYWTCNKRKHLVNAIESFYWLSPNPKDVNASNKRVLTEYSEKHKKLIADAVGRKPAVSYRPSGTHINTETIYADNGGTVPHNLMVATPEGAASSYSRYCKERGLPRHPAMFPNSIPEFLIEFLTERDGLVADPYSGSFKVGKAAEKLGRFWAGAELVKEYIDGSVCRFDGYGLSRCSHP